MSRPTRIEDLSLYDQQGQKIATFDPAVFLSLPRKALVRILKTLESLDTSVANGLLDKEGNIEGGDEITYYLRPTQKDLEKKLRDAQRSWDRNKELYEEALTDPNPIPRYMHWSVDDWARKEDKPAIPWPDTRNS